MKILIITGIIALIMILVWYAKKNGVTSEFKPETIKIETEKDSPIDFGYKTVWIAVKTNNKQRISEILKLKNIQPSNWKSGIETAYNNGVFITPQVGQWTLAVGMKLVNNGNLESINQLEKTLNKLSSEFGEAQSFGTHRVVEYHHWMKSVDGETKRIYSYIGESGENIKVYGDITESENGLNLFNSLSKEAESDEYWEREDLDYADEELVMKIAENWSVNPTKLTERKDFKNELGLTGN
ncbi:hypothetical protein SAMN05216474_0349 [Lishizhenia tianjinensis]|uniref:Uncharacterized protein n=1 Tax=Lishizhenia tianjinensis TaxID=477690 RepID=A0A1I6XQJ9_9FLAO|nr:hypothetical protein [Lishizhenia tianjinensis]SFT40014.1 hypothetical protein SAMN05216474_0349 [Lishizhenia tianjinensis]